MYLFFSSCPSATHKGSSQFTSYIRFLPANPLTFLLHMWYPSFRSPVDLLPYSHFKDLLILIWFFEIEFPESWAHSSLSKGDVPQLRLGSHIFSITDHKLLKQIFLVFCFCFLPSQPKLSPLPMPLTWNQIKWNLYKKNTFKGTLRNIREKVSCVCCLMLEKVMEALVSRRIPARDEIRSSIRQLLPTANLFSSLLFLFREVESSSPLLKTASCAVSIKAKNPSARNCPEEWTRRKSSKSRLLLL